ncbi:MAG: VWA-like domain-containing protein [Ruminococcus sp.]
MNPQDILFENSRQFHQKLSIAVSRFFQDGPLEPPLSRQYEAFLRQRPFTVLQWILYHYSPDVLKKYLDTGWTSRSDLKRGLEEKEINVQMRALLLGALSNASLTAGQASADPLSFLTLTQLKLFERLPRLRLALSRFTFTVTQKSTGTDGRVIWYNPQQIISLFRQDTLEKYCFHMIVHCLWLHIVPPAGRDPRLWNLACDISAFHLTEQLLPEVQEAFSRPKEIVRLLPPDLDLSSAVSVCEFLSLQNEDTLSAWQEIFTVDEHSFWYLASHPGDLNEWSRLRRELGNTPSPARQRFGLTPGSRLERIELHRMAKFDFRRYLRRFTVTEEEMQIDPDSFDYIPYLYGLKHYGNLLLAEPLEYTETSKVEELVIAIDTSGSCSTVVVQQFLAETCRLLTDKQNFFRRMNVHILQCDSMIQDHTSIHSVEEWEKYIAHIKISGRGGTDFTPVFSYTDRMIREKKFRRLKGLLYFTDGDGVYPQKAPSYETAFVFTDRRYLQQPVPDWAAKLCLNMT